MQPLVTVAISTYQHARFIDECLASILSQDYPNLQIVVGDDQSIDGTLAIVERLAAMHPGRIEFAPPAPPQRSDSGSKNRLLPLIRGELVVFIDGDDVFYPSKLRRQVEYFRQHPEVDIVYHDARVFLHDDPARNYLYSKKVPPFVGGPGEIVRRGTPATLHSLMFRRACLPNELPPSIQWGIDWLLLIEATRRGRLAYIDDVLVGYRQHGHQSSQTARRGPDYYRTLDYVESRYPELHQEIRAGRAFLHLERSILLMRQGDIRGARQLARQALRLRRRWGPRALGWLAIVSLGIRPPLGRLWKKDQDYWDSES